MIIRKAEPAEFELIMDFYNFMVDYTDGKPSSPRWEKDVHPTRDEIRESIEKGQIYVAARLEDEELTPLDGENAVLAVMRLANEPYHAEGAQWKNDVPDDQIGTISLLAVNPDAQGKGMGRKLVKIAISEFMSMGVKSIRLDTIDGNDKAARLYESMRFTKVGRGALHPATIPGVMFDVFEYALPIISLDD